MLSAPLRATFVALLAATVSARGAGEPSLALDPVFPALGTTATVTLTGAPGDTWILFFALGPVEAATPFGTLYLDPATLQTAGVGSFVAGEVALPLPIPTGPALVGAEVYLQALVGTVASAQLTNSRAMRLEEAAPDGPRATLSVAASPDGAVAFAAHRDDGTLSVVDLDTGAVRTEIPIGPSAKYRMFDPVHVAVDPEGRHAFAINAAAQAITVVDVATASVAAKLPVPEGCRRVAFDFGASDRVYVTNQALHAVLVFDEVLPGFFVPGAPLPLEGTKPGPLLVLGDGRLLVGDLGTAELELVDPGLGTLERLPLAGLPFDLALDGDEVLVPTFVPNTLPVPGDGHNQVLRVGTDPALEVLGVLFEDLGTDYLDVDVRDGIVAVTAAGSGSLVLATAGSHTVLDVVDLAPSQPLATPRQAVITATGGVLVANLFRETLLPVQLDAPPPFSLDVEIALAHSGVPRLPFVDLSAEENGDWFLRSVQFFNGTPANPNPVTCATCHPDHASHGRPSNLNDPKTLFLQGDTAPFGSKGVQGDLVPVITGAFQAHGQLGGALSPVALADAFTFLVGDALPPPSPFLPPSPAALAGQALFEGTAGCTSCHAAPFFIPADPAPLTVASGVGTGLVPANVPSLLGIQASEPYFHDGSAATLEDVLLRDTGDLHGQTSTLTATEREQLVEYLKTL